jgi:hypothetical protein
MEFYIAARFTEKDEVKRIYQLLSDQGHGVTADWTTHTPIKPYDQNPETAKEYATEDMRGVEECDVFVLLTSENTGSGSAAELGGAIMSHLRTGKPRVYVIGEHQGNNVFYFHPSVSKKASIDEVLAEIS